MEPSIAVLQMASQVALAEKVETERKEGLVTWASPAKLVTQETKVAKDRRVMMVPLDLKAKMALRDFQAPTVPSARPARLVRMANLVKKDLPVERA